MIAGWTGNYIAGKISLQAFPPVLLYGLRISMAGILILPAYWWERRRMARSWTLRDVPHLVVLGVFGVALNQFLFVLGLSRTSVAHSSIFANTTPILILLLASVRGLERLTGWKLAGVLMALTGVVLLARSIAARTVAPPWRETSSRLAARWPSPSSQCWESPRPNGMAPSP